MNWLTNHWNTFIDGLYQDLSAFTGGGFQRGFITALVLWILYKLLVYRLTAKINAKCKGFVIPGDKGDVFITTAAMKEFVSRILSEFGEATIGAIKLDETKKCLYIELDINASPETIIPNFKEQLQDRIIEQAELRLGITRPIRINISVDSMSADEKKIARQTKKARPLASFETKELPENTLPPAEAEEEKTPQDHDHYQ